MLFYLMSRGLSENGARLVIVESNIRPVIDQLGDETLANKALRAVREKMEFCTQKGICDEKCTERLPNHYIKGKWSSPCLFRQSGNDPKALSGHPCHGGPIGTL